MMLLDIVTFLGRLHPVVVHLPIGFLLVGAAFDLLSYIPRYRILKEAVSIALLAGFLSAVIACILGYLLSLGGEYDPGILGNHRLGGIMLAIASGILWSMTTSIYVPYVVIPRKIITALCVGIVAMLVYTGHQGGSLTHGSDYLSLETLTHEKRVKPVKAEEALIFEDVVHPMLERRCGGCHRKGKRKGELIVTAYEELMKGGKHGAVIIAGKPDESELYRRITLDPSHEDFMPTDGKTPLTRMETEMIRWWIEKGNAAKETKITSVKEHESMLPVIAIVLELPGVSPLPETDIAMLRPVNPLIPTTTDMAAVDNLRRKGLSIRIMLHAPIMLDVTLPSASGIAMQEIQKDLNAVEKNVIWLNLSDNNFTEADLSILENMTNVEKLRLERNPIGDGVVDLLSKLKHLEALNVNETRLTEDGLARLRQHPCLKRIYTWKTFVHGSN
jgi:uncharacterized membrane protein